jgi:hypothetical protein
LVVLQTKLLSREWSSLLNKIVRCNNLSNHLNRKVSQNLNKIILCMESNHLNRNVSPKLRLSVLK